MQKVLDLLEQYVEWVALAIGGLFLLFMVFVYVIGTPVSTKLGTRNVTLANVESVTYDESGRQLEQAMNHNDVPTAKIESYAAEFKNHMVNVNPPQPAAPTPVVWVAAPGAPASPLKQEDKPDKAVAPQQAVGIPQNLPAPKYFGFSSGKANVQTDPAKAAGMPMGGMGGPAGMPPGMAPDGFGGMPPGMMDYGGPPPWVMGGMPQPGPGAAPGAPAAPGAKPEEAGPGGTDKVWVTVAYTITAKELAAKFEEAKVPTNLATVFLRLDATRQEQLADGSWGNDTKIEPLPFHQVPPFPKATPIDERQYADWASKNATTLLAPNFYPRFAGDNWFAPGQPNPNKVSDVRPVIQQTVPPQGPTQRRGRGAMQGGPPDMGGMGGPPTGGGRGRGRQRYVPQDAERPALPFMQYMPPEAVEAMRRAQQEAQSRGGMYGGPPADMYGGNAPGFGRPQTSVPEGYKVPSGTFNPAELDSDIFVWFHDETAQPGKTYRYKLSYRIRNPLHGMDKLAKDPNAAKIFAIASAESDWSEPVTVDAITRFFVASGVNTGASSVRFDVFRWQDGKWHMKQFSASPGDMIGLVDGKIDYQTGWTLADLNAGSLSREPVIVADPRGTLGSRSFQGDQGASGKFEKEIGWKDPNAPVRPVPGMDGMPPGYGGPPPGYGGPPPGYGGPPPGFGGN